MSMPMTWPEKDLLTDVFSAAVAAAQPDLFFQRKDVREALSMAAKDCDGRIVVLGAGKAAAAMAAALEQEWSAISERPVSGLVVTRDGYEQPTKDIQVRRAGHPTPDHRGQAAARAMLDQALSLNENDVLVGLWSGGGSSLLAAPPDGIAQEAIADLTNRLLASGATIHEINAVRKHLSQIAGGRLAQAAAPARLINFIIPDVVNEGDETAFLSAIASGPCVPDPTTLGEAIKVLKRHGIIADHKIAAHLKVPTNETPKTWAGIGVSAHQTHTMNPHVAVEAATRALEAKGFEIAHKDAAVVGEAREVAAHHAELALSFAKSPAAEGQPMTMAMAMAMVTGGELTVTLTNEDWESAKSGPNKGGPNKGGPNQEYALALALALDGAANISALAADTDGIDGVGGAAGALVAPDTLARMHGAGIDARAALANNDSGSAFEAIGDLLITGPAFTNVNDLRLIVING